MSSENPRASASSRPSARDLRTEEAHALLGQIVNDRYRIEQIIGIGGVGTVYRATQLGLERRVAIKVLRPELLRSQTALARFTREAQVAANLQHPNIVTVHDFGMMRDGRAFLVMEYLKGLDLAQWLRSKRPTDVGIASRYLKAACDAVSALHRNGIIHRDIKPSNIMIAAQPGGGSIVKIVDFGFVRPAISDETMDITGGLVVGTPEFMAPELFSGGKPDVLSDIYALGVTTYEVFTGELPFGVGSFREMFERHSHEPPRPPTSIRPDLPVEVDAIVARSLAKNREHRYASAEAMSVEFAFLSRSSTRGDTGSLAQREGEPSSDERETKIASILLVEDDKVVRQLFVAHLERRMFDVITASDGIEAFIQLGKRKFDLVISDIQMPNLNGMELLRLKSEKGIDTPVIFLTGSATEAEERLAVERGAAGFIHKSPRVDELIAKINEVLGLN